MSISRVRDDSHRDAHALGWQQCSRGRSEFNCARVKEEEKGGAPIVERSVIAEHVF